jgi:hypothetical protein
MAEAKELEIRALERAAQLRPAHAQPTQASSAQGIRKTGKFVGAIRPGRQHGAISRPWRKVLGGIYADGANEPVDIGGIVLLADINGIENIEESSARARMRAYAERGYITEEGRKFRVTPLAVARFALDKEKN